MATRPADFEPGLLTMHSVFVAALALAPGALIATAPDDAAGHDPVRFDRDVRPLLADRCFHCHGPDEAERRAGLRLDRADGEEGSYRSRRGSTVIAPGSLAESELWSRITTDDPDAAMPPPDSDVEPLSPEERALVGRWIEEGAVYEDFWAFVAPTPQPPPAVADEPWVRQPLDRFVLRALEDAGLEPSPRADARTLARRVSLDLTGLPPTRAEIRAFLDDAAATGSDRAYERLVDRLLAGPRYGEHMAKSWLDLVRFADTNGVHHDHYREMSPYRDWVIRAFNANQPYDRFVFDQLAGDLAEMPTDDQLVASGFNRLHMIIDRGTALPEESFARNVIDRTTAAGTAFLGLTVQCAVCHDHKYDPFTQRDFYSLSAFFNNIDADPETGSGGLDKRRGLQPPYVEFPSAEQRAALAALDERIAAARERVEALRAAAGEGAAPNEELQALTEEVKRLEAERNEVRVAVPAAMVMRERAEVRPTHVLVRGAYDQPGELVERGTPAFLPPLARAGEVATRADLARWLVAPEHPLTARVTVNRFWQQFFGVGLVKTAEDFGTQGEYPSHVDLLDHLAVSFVESGWDIKALVRRIVLSATYAQSSAASPGAFAQDPENRLLARGARFRLDAEVIRDQVLATSGLLNGTMYGRSVKPPQPPGIWKAVTLPSSFPRVYEPDDGNDIYRRSVYTFWKRGMPPPQMSILDAPTREACTARRERTNTPLQALLLLNEREYFRAARHLAATVLASEARSSAARLDAIHETITTRLTDEHARATLLALARDLEAQYEAKPELAAAACDGVALEDGTSAAELAAWTLIASAIYNLDAVKTRE